MTTARPVLTLVEFLTARLDEDEEIARAATAGRWEAVGVHETYEIRVAGGDITVVYEGNNAEDYARGGVQEREDAEHIARHRPARVLAEVAAKRKIVELHRMGTSDGDGWPEQFCVLCDGEPEYPCPTLRALASVYADHEQYRQEWA